MTLACSQVLQPDVLSGATLRVLSIRQPWATLLASGVKTIETRSWGTTYRGLIAIHAAKTWGAAEEKAMADAVLTMPVLLSGEQPWQLSALRRTPRETLGCVIALANLVDCQPMTEAPNEVEEMFGYFGPGRFGWRLECPCPLAKLVPLSGKLGLFTHTFPDRIATGLAP